MLEIGYDTMIWTNIFCRYNERFYNREVFVTVNSEELIGITDAIDEVSHKPMSL